MPLLPKRPSSARILEALERVVPWRADAAPREIATGVLRYTDPRRASQPIPPFPAFIVEPDPAAPIATPPASAATQPRFASIGKQYQVAHLSVEVGTDLYGTGEVAGPLCRNGRRTTCWNTDAFGYSEESPSLYQSHPYVLGVRRDGSAFGVICSTTYPTEIDLSAGIRFRTRSPLPAPIVVIERPSPQDVVSTLAELTGFMPLPPRWALGYHQCRYSYEPDTRVQEIADGFRSRNLPCDVIWMDIDYMHGFRCFTFDPEKFAQPAELNTYLHDRGFKAIWMIDPGIKKDPGYHAHDQMVEGNHFVRTAKGEPYVGPVWPGDCLFPDFTRASVREWWGSLYDDYINTGIDGVWNDMNEPAVFNEQNDSAVVPAARTMPKDNQHDADAELGGPGDHARYHNVYGVQMVRGTRDAIQRINPDKRPFVLTRAGFLGSQRYAATWTGDNLSDWNHLRWSVSMALNLGLSGQPLVGPDIGGFGDEATPELFARWMGIGCLLPFARGHTIKESGDHEPWSFGERTEHVSRLALERRYRLMPYLYTLAREASTTGAPIVRPVFFLNPADPKLRAIDDAFLLGSDVLVRCALDESPEIRSFTPEGFWPEFEPTHTSNAQASERDADLPALHLRPCSIVPMGPLMQHTGEKPLDPLTLLVTLDEHNAAQGTIYRDSGEGFAYREGDSLLATYSASRTGNTVTIERARSDGSLPEHTHGLHVQVRTHDGKYAEANGRDGETLTLELSH